MPRRSFTVVAALLAFVAIAGARDASAGGSGAIYVVDTTVDNPSLDDCLTGVANDCSLRAAIIHANADNDPTTIIRFTIGTGFKTITPVSQLPAITAPVTMDGTTQICSIANPHPPCIRISGVALGGAHGLDVMSTGVNINGLAIGFFDGSGILFGAGGGGTVTRSFIGTFDGSTAAANTEGIVSLPGAGNVVVGGPSAIDRNVISGNFFDDVLLREAGATVQNNLIGTNLAGAAALSGINSRIGVELVEGEGAVIGNVISGHSDTGLAVLGQGTHIESNLIGTDMTGTSVIGNGVGVLLEGSNHILGGDQPGQGNVISGSGPTAFHDVGTGVLVRAAGGMVIEGNLIGTNVTGNVALSNDIGVQVGQDNFGTALTIVGGDAPGARNVISGNSQDGILVDDAINTVITGNYIGVGADGSTAIPNEVGVSTVKSSGVTIGGSTPGERNVITGNEAQGIRIETTDIAVVSGNYIGLDSSGATAVPNVAVGILPINSTNLLIGGTTAGERNVISGNDIGIGTSFQNGMAVRGNYIGLNAAGTTAIPNTGWGILLLPNNSDTTNDNEISGNVVSGNGIDGIAIQPAVNTAAGNNNRITNNIIGLNPSGTLAIPNGGAGVEIGVPGQGTTIGNTISENSIDTNGGLGIDIQSTDPIPNPPVLASATSGSTHVTGTLSTFGDQTIRLEFFASPSCDPSGSGEGRDFLGAEDVLTDIGGDAAIDVTLPSAPVGHVITATATDVNGSTSEFSNCVTVTGATPAATPTPTPTATPTATPTSTSTATPTPTPTASPSGLTQGDVDCNGDVSSVDALKELRHVAELSVSQNEPCPDIGAEVAAVWGDVDCNGQVTSVDALKILRHVALLSVTQNDPCPDIGDPES